jgi:mono/diheme cytochrome c family protein
MLPALALLATFECNRCHDGVGTPAKLEKHCVRCHGAIIEGSWNAPKEMMDAWRPNLISFAAVPSLEDLSGFRREWVASFLMEPHDLRPNLRGMMPRLPIDEAQARELAAHLVKDDRSEPIPNFDRAVIRRGRALFESLQCGSCHAYSGVLAPKTAPVEMTEAMRLAPDLRHTRERLQPSYVRTLLVKPRSKMPVYNLEDEEVGALAAFLLAEPLQPIDETPVPSRLPLLARPVSFAEVKTEIFEKACMHCHANPDKSFNDGGPGNTGGFGYKGRGLSFMSYREAQSGSIGDDGERRSVFAKQGDTPKVIAHLMARYEEVRGREVPETLGMPMGLPPLSLEQIQLLESWIAQGRPQ